MSSVVVLDAVGVAMIAHAARDLRRACDEHALLPDAVVAALHAHRGRELGGDERGALSRYADELDEIAEATVLLDQHDHEIEHQLRWWGDRIRSLEMHLTGHPIDDFETVRELALYRGRISGALTMRRHYAEQRTALLGRHREADEACARALDELS
ncbi:MAG: hypothetical protein KF727_08410 [Microbacteriaceae bacterium]|nr:hypothetical protein [Microbacteriaceae bacterium]